MAVQYREYPSYAIPRVLQPTSRLTPRRESGRAPERTPESSRAVPGLRLDSELERARLFGERYLPTFIDNLRYYAAETYGKVPVSVYEHLLQNQPDGSLRLAYPHSGELARESYMKPLEDDSLPDWYLERVRKDITYITKLEEELLPHLEIGDIVCNPSPASLEVDMEERKARQMGNQSFLFLHQVARAEDGKKTLRSVAFRNYLNLNQQAALYKELTGEEVDPENLLGQIAVVSNTSQLSDLADPQQLEAFHQRQAHLYLEADPSERVQIPHDDTLTWSDDEVKRTMQELQPLLIALFYLIQQSDNKSYIAEQFAVWGQIARKMIRKENISSEERQFFTTMTPDFLLQEAVTIERDLQMQFLSTYETAQQPGMTVENRVRQHAPVFDPRIQLLVAAQENQDTNSCGFGIGFASPGDTSAAVGISQFSVAGPGSNLAFFMPGTRMTNESASSYKADGVHEACVKCPCKNKFGQPCGNEKNNKMVVKGGKIQKYICGKNSCPSNKK